MYAPQTTYPHAGNAHTKHVLWYVTASETVMPSAITAPPHLAHFGAQCEA